MSSNDLVAYSRAGDVFHYRWAARRCLGLIHPNTSLNTVVIEGSNEKEKEGEYVIDVAEYYDEVNDIKHIKYYQLKHTTVRKDAPFVLSDLEDTIKGFSNRFSQHLNQINAPVFSFNIVTNRPISKSFKKNITLLVNDKKVDIRFKQTIEKYTKLSQLELREFCSLLKFQDSEGDYNIQKDELRLEIAQLVSGAVDNAQIDSIVALVQERVLPNSEGTIFREDILKRFGISSERELFPAPALWEKAENIIKRKEYEELINSISHSSHPIIVHAPGGVGKSVFCRQLIDSLPSNSVGIAYDCFGAGRYRNRSEPRHRHRDALVQIINELAVIGLCDPLLIQYTSQDSDIMKKFLVRIETSIKTLRQIDASAILFVLIDAADNAEMAADEYRHPCFANELIRENIPEGCKLVLLCRTERIHLLKPNSKVSQFALEPYSETESLINLRKWFPQSEEKDGTEFHRLTNGNPRVQANALSVYSSTVSELLVRLGPAGTTVEQQIELQLTYAVAALKDSLPDVFQKKVQAICIGLASLPPHIPIKILAKAAGVTIETIKSFVADIGRTLWLYDESVQFRDEPTETWFRETFLAKKEDFENYIKILEPLANQHTYVAEVLPHLYLQAEQYKKLIQIALSDDYLPEDNPIDARNVRVYRLQFAFRAALKAKQYNDAIIIATRAGEEVAGNERQIVIFRNNVDLFVALQDKQKVQDIAFKRILKGAWNGSENVYTGSLLSGITEYKGEARGYLRAAENWLLLYYEELQKSKDGYLQSKVTREDVIELSYTFFNIDGASECIDFLNRFTSKPFVFGIIQSLAKRLVDIGNFEAIDDLLRICTRQPYYTVAIVSELVKIGKFPEAQFIETCIDLLVCSKSRIKKTNQYYYDDNITSAIVSFTEACLHSNLESNKLLRVLRHYIPERASKLIYSEYQFQERVIFLKVLAIRSILKEKTEVNVDDILPQDLIEKGKKNDYDRDNNINKFKEVINGLLPWYLLRCKILSQKDLNFKEEVENANEKSKQARNNRYRSHDVLPQEIASIQSSILILFDKGTVEEVSWLFDNYIVSNKNLRISSELALVRAAFRLSHLYFLKAKLEHGAYKRIKEITDDRPEQIAERYIELARAVLNIASDDASVYFEDAVNIVSKFGDEIVGRWKAVVSLAKQACNGGSISDELAYRFIRCAEVVGEYVTREKHWNRDESIAVCTRMSSGQGIAALSRWRDRNIGRFEYQLEALLIELIKSRKVSSSVGWAMSRFCSYNQFEKLLSLCLEKEADTEIKHNIFADAISRLKIEGAHDKYFKKMHGIAIKHKIQNSTLDRVLSYYLKDTKQLLEEGKNKTFQSRNLTDNKVYWETVFGTLNILNIEQFEKCLTSFNTISKESFQGNQSDFWDEVIKRLNEKDLWKFIDVLLFTEINYYELNLFSKSLPEVWKSKVSFQRKRPDLITKFGAKFAKQLLNKYSYENFIKYFNLNNKEINKLKEGILEGLENGYEFSDSEMFFDFTNLFSPLVNPENAATTLDLTLTRFELHIENDFGDGEWEKKLHTSKSVNKNIAGFIWSALGSPKSSERWNAAHTVKVLAKFNCTDILEELINWMQKDTVDALGSHRFPFYKLHARLYLLIAFARISIDTPEVLYLHKSVFLYYAFNEPHILIQKFSAEIAINLSDSIKTIYDEETLSMLKSVGKTRIPIAKANYDKSIVDYLQIDNEISNDSKFYFGWDFENYWFKPLAGIFRLPEKKLEVIASDIIFNELEGKEKTGYYNDPRVDIWDEYSYEEKTSHSHGSYPRADNLDFYLSYHSLMITASKLIENIPTTNNIDSYDNHLDKWLKGHLLTCTNGKWLSDYRGPVPISRPEWISKKNDENWRTDVSENDFCNTLLAEDEIGEKWINIFGGWEEVSNGKTESFSITSSLVSKRTSDSLMNALQTCSNPNDFKLPNYEEEAMEINADSFWLKGWIQCDSISKGLDEYDPYGDNVDYPPYVIGEDIVNKLNLSANSDKTIWHYPNSSHPALKCEIWSSHRTSIDENPDQAGKRMKASLQFLKDMCLAFDCVFILRVQQRREISFNYYSRDNKNEYYIPKHKIFILTSDGELKTTGTSVKLG